jgi:predicted acetyltransferase
VRSSAAATETQIVMPLDHLPALSAAALESENRPGSVMAEALVLRRPREDEEDEFVRAHRATTPEVPHFLHYYQEGMSFGRYLEVLDEQEQGVNLLPDHVPSTFLFAFKGQRIVGRVSIRHMLNDFLLRVGGHIGYVVVPQFRRQGHATAILRLGLHIAHEKLGIRRVLVTCDDDNVGSIRTIENNGGILEDVITGLDLDKPKRRYWISARGGAA